MGYVKNISFVEFPIQGNLLGKAVEVLFHYDSTRVFMGRVVRDDREHPFRTLIQLSDGRVVEGSECQFSINNKRYPDDLEVVEKVRYTPENRDFVREWAKAEVKEEYANIKLPNGDYISYDDWIYKDSVGNVFGYYPTQHFNGVQSIMDTIITKKAVFGGYILKDGYTVSNIIAKLGHYEHVIYPNMIDVSLIKSALEELKEGIDTLRTQYKIIGIYDADKVALALEQLSNIGCTNKEEEAQNEQSAIKP